MALKSKSGRSINIGSKDTKTHFMLTSTNNSIKNVYIYIYIYTHTHIHTYGTMDFIFRNAIVVFQNCSIYACNPPNKINTITAQSIINPNQTSGIFIQNCTITVALDLKPVQSLVKPYLERPCKEYSRTVFLKTYLDDLIDSRGWKDWNGTNFALKIIYYGEYMNTGPRSSTSGRVK